MVVGKDRFERRGVDCPEHRVCEVTVNVGGSDSHCLDRATRREELGKNASPSRAAARGDRFSLCPAPRIGPSERGSDRRETQKCRRRLQRVLPRNERPTRGKARHHRRSGSSGPGRVRQITSSSVNPARTPSLPAHDPRDVMKTAHPQNRDDLVKVARSERLGVVGEYLLRRACSSLFTSFVVWM